jgi:hypothetical protein
MEKSVLNFYNPNCTKAIVIFKNDSPPDEDDDYIPCNLLIRYADFVPYDYDKDRLIKNAMDIFTGFLQDEIEMEYDIDVVEKCCLYCFNNMEGEFEYTMQDDNDADDKCSLFPIYMLSYNNDFFCFILEKSEFYENDTYLLVKWLSVIKPDPKHALPLHPITVVSLQKDVSDVIKELLYEPYDKIIGDYVGNTWEFGDEKGFENFITFSKMKRLGDKKCVFENGFFALECAPHSIERPSENIRILRREFKKLTVTSTPYSDQDFGAFSKIEIDDSEVRTMAYFVNLDTLNLRRPV